MQIRSLALLFLFVLIASCYGPERNCQDFKDGSFSFTTSLDGKEISTRFTREGELEVDYYEGRADSASVRWINDCEYVVRKLNPRNRAEEKSVHIKILSTTENSYTFEYGIVGDKKKSRGTAIKIN